MRIVCVIAYACRQQQENVYNKCRNTHVYYCVLYQITTSSPYSFLFTTSLCTNIHDSSLFTTTSLCPNILPCLTQHHCVPIFITVCTTTPMCPPYVLLSGTTTSLCTMQYSALFTTITPLSPYSSLCTTKLKCTPYLIHLCLQTTVSPYSSLVTISPPCRNIHPCTHNQPWLPYHHPVAIFIPGYINTSVSPFSSMFTISALSAT